MSFDAFPRPQIQNVVVTMGVGVALWLPAVAKKLRVGEYNPARFSAVTFRLRHPKTTALFFSSGKVVCTGAKCVLDATLACYKYALCLRRRAQINANVYDLCVQNIVSTVNLDMFIDLDKFHDNNPTECNYDSSLFPGAIWRGRTCTKSMVVLLFQSGRMVITGAKHRRDIHDTYATVLPLVVACALANEPPPTTRKARRQDAGEVKQIIHELIHEGIMPPSM